MWPLVSNLSLLGGLMGFLGILYKPVDYLFILFLYYFVLQLVVQDRHLLLL